MATSSNDTTATTATERQARDAAWFARLRQHDVRALEALVHAYTPRLGALAFAMLGADDFVEDVVQDVFVALWEQRETIDIHANVAGYLYRATRNRALDVRRSETSRARVMDTLRQTTPITAPIAVNAAEDMLDSADIMARLDAVLGALPPGPRQVFLLRWESDLSYAEIASLLGISVPAVRQLMYRATQRLAEYFTPM